MPAYDESYSPPAPIAEAILRSPDTGELVSNISMLLDTGADLTLVPLYWLPVKQSHCVRRIIASLPAVAREPSPNRISRPSASATWRLWDDSPLPLCEQAARTSRLDPLEILLPRELAHAG